MSLSTHAKAQRRQRQEAKITTKMAKRKSGLLATTSRFLVFSLLFAVAVFAALRLCGFA
jgi:hypothetical protein